ncbi:MULTISPECIES: hypothetical protein [unclassified Sphingomonas]|uniref:hypothetical protein n=1 Tax=unclassified Sphingomonas TaxID=196159 RepID=UPI002269C2CD|nr:MULTISPECIES: hypothetical protein [unclassified Sphingomonas]
MIIESETDRRRLFAAWLRTGKLPPVRGADGLELKFNPYHDPRDGRFTFAPGGARATYDGASARAQTQARLAPAPEPPVVGRGGNSRAFEDPMTLRQSFPQWRGTPGGAVFAVADNLFDLTGPAEAAKAELLQGHARQLMAQIKAMDPAWHYDEIVPTDATGNPIQTVAGLTAKVNDLRFQRAAMIARIKGNYEPLQVETLRFLQESVDVAYDQGLVLLRNGRLKTRLSNQEALGNYIDRQVRTNLLRQYNRLGIISDGAGPVRVNRREYSDTDGDRTYRRPDARVDDIAIDVTLTRKTLGTSQVRGFFNADFRPRLVIIVRPRQVGADHAYAISRPERTQ